MARQLQGMVVAITGASAGIGKTLAEKLSASGARPGDVRGASIGWKNSISSWAGIIYVLQADVGKTTDCENFVRRSVEHFGRLDTLVCNAGYGFVRTVAETSHDEMRQIFETNVFGTTDCIHAAVAIMVKQELRDGYRGQIVIVSSAAAKRGLPFFGAYAATKAAQLSLAEALRVELKPRGIAVTSVHPIGTNTEFFGVAEGKTGMRRPVTDARFRQSARTVARKMARAIEHPKIELWPLRPSRWLLNFQAFIPNIADRVMGRYYRQIDEINRP